MTMKTVAISLNLAERLHAYIYQLEECAKKANADAVDLLGGDEVVAEFMAEVEKAQADD